MSEIKAVLSQRYPLYCASLPTTWNVHSYSDEPQDNPSDTSAVEYITIQLPKQEWVNHKDDDFCQPVHGKQRVYFRSAEEDEDRYYLHFVLSH